MDFELAVVLGRSASNTIKLADGVTLIGRHDACQLRIKSSQVSRKHCEIFEKKGLLLVKDLNSSNGTLVNGKKVEGQHVLEAGDELTIGPIQLRVVKIGAAGSKPGGKAGDTAVTAALAAAGESAGDDDDFALSLDDTTQAVEPVAVAAPKKPAPKPKAPQTADDDDFADFLIDMPIEEDEEEVPGDSTEATQVVPLAAASPKPTPPSKVAATTTPPPKAEAKQQKATEPEAADDAIADFLLDIKLEDE